MEQNPDCMLVEPDAAGSPTDAGAPAIANAALVHAVARVKIKGGDRGR